MDFDLLMGLQELIEDKLYRGRPREPPPPIKIIIFSAAEVTLHSMFNPLCIGVFCTTQ